jgi:transcriptional regulator with XRE-family HTH domain
MIGPGLTRKQAKKPAWRGADKIRSRRLELRMLQKVLGERLGQNQSYVSRLESGAVKDITATMLRRLSKVLRLSMEALFVPDDNDETLPQAIRKGSSRAPQTLVEKAALRVAAMQNKQPKSVHRLEELPPVNVVEKRQP